MRSLSNVTCEGEANWISVSDMMAGLMMVFLLLSVALMRHAYEERDRVKEVAVAYQQNQVAIYDALYAEFNEDLIKWDAVLEEDTLTFTFRSPDVLFAEGSQTIREEYARVLDSFLPRYVEVLKPYQSSIGEVRIEGHTSSRWNHRTGGDASFQKNMALSQERTRSVLGYLLGLESLSSHRTWIKDAWVAVGFSSARVLRDAEGREDEEASRRVTFRVITNADIQIKSILES